MKKQAVGKQENVLLFEIPLTEKTGFTICWNRLQSNLINLGRPKLQFSSAHVKYDISSTFHPTVELKSNANE